MLKEQGMESDVGPDASIAAYWSGYSGKSFPLSGPQCLHL